ncbi:hypothetical protein [Streptomyces sp. C36]|uniref:hypothetical protein n=1 Tax=Streptomyces sp. C36 TaxID=3237122 RepID=UPI0034C5B806
MLSRRGLVPYIATWSEEQPIRAVIIANPRQPGIAFVNENPQDRDTFGVLWGTNSIGWGKGSPQLGHVHPQRQRRAMNNLLCQVCAGPADERFEKDKKNKDGVGVLWLLDGDVPEPEGEITSHPPVCVPCARLSVRHCPQLRKGYTAVRVQAPTIDGVYGRLYHPAHPSPVAGKKGYVHYTNPDVRWVLAAQLFVTLHNCTVVNLDELAHNADMHVPSLT